MAVGERKNERLRTVQRATNIKHAENVLQSDFWIKLQHLWQKIKGDSLWSNKTTYKEPWWGTEQAASCAASATVPQLTDSGGDAGIVGLLLS